MSIRVNFEIGHEASIRTKATPEGFTHDWAVFVRGSEGQNIGHFVDKVVFHLHETFPKPKRVLKEPPFLVKESGYAGFLIPIEVYLKNKDEPKKIKFSYDLNLHQTGPDTYNHMNEQYVFHNPNEDFRKKLLKGGGFVTNHTSYGSHEERNSRDSFTDEKPQLISKPKLSGDAAKKHKPKEHRYDMPRPSNSFVNLFGPPIQKSSKVSPDPKKVAPPPPPPAPTPVKQEKKEKEKSSSDKDKQKSKHEHKEKRREEKDKAKEEKRSHKEAEKTKEKSSKRPNERPPSPPPVLAKKRCPSPPRRPPSPPSKAHGPAEVKAPKVVEPEKKIIKIEAPEVKEKEKEKEKKSKKEKKSHEKDKDRSKKDNKKENHKSSKEPPKEPPKEPSKPKEIEIKKEKEPTVEPPPQVKEKPQKPDKPFNKFSTENLAKKVEPQKPEETKQKEKGESERKHKHKKKDKKREESREKHKDSKKHKHDKQVKEQPPPEAKETPPAKQDTPKPVELDRPIKVEPASPISIDTSSQCSSKSGKISKTRNSVGLDDVSATSHSDSDSGPEEEDDSKYKSKVPSRPPDPPLVKVEPKPPTPAPEPERPTERCDRQQAGPSAPQQQKEKTKKHKDKSKRADGDDKKKRKRKSSTKADETDSKVQKTESSVLKKPADGTPGSKPSKSETKLQDNGVSSSLGEEAEEVSGASDSEPRRDASPEAGDLSPDYMIRLKELQKRIMTIKSNEELERVVNLIAETGRYEVTTQTFDFDLCLLDRSTVQRLIELIG